MQTNDMRAAGRARRVLAAPHPAPVVRVQLVGLRLAYLLLLVSLLPLQHLRTLFVQLLQIENFPVGSWEEYRLTEKLLIRIE